MQNLIVVDTREKGHKKILEYFDKVGQDYIPSKLDVGDYMLFKDFSMIIDRKDSLDEICGNLTGKTKRADGTFERNRDRLAREVDKAHELGCEEFIFLIQHNKIKTTEDIYNWKSKYSIVTGRQLAGIMREFKEKHGCKYMIVPRKEMAQTIIDLLTKK